MPIGYHKNETLNPWNADSTDKNIHPKIKIHTVCIYVTGSYNWNTKAIVFHQYKICVSSA